MRGKVHRHVELAATEGDETMPVPHAHAVASIERANRISLLRLSVPARLLIVAIASVLLWGAVLWALV
ncbi:MAG: hypothetical protein ACXWVQ_06500 [Methyloceanibacter sp.]